MVSENGIRQEKLIKFTNRSRSLKKSSSVKKQKRIKRKNIKSITTHKIDSNSSNSAYDTESFVEGTYMINDIKNDDINSDNADKKILTKID